MYISLMNKSGVKDSGYVHGISCISMIESPEICSGDGKKKVVAAKDQKSEELMKELHTCSSSSTSSIGKNSDISGRSMENSGDTVEVQSSYEGGPLDDMEALEEVLPIRRGISNFYNGKSKSFASLADASSTSSIKDVAKPENAYIRKRRNLPACSLAWDKNNKKNKNRSSPLKLSNGGGISKRGTNSSRTNLALAVTMSSSESYNTNSENLSPPSSLLRNRLLSQFRDYQSNGSSMSSPRQNFSSAWRSLSLADLQHFVSIAAPCTSTTTTTKLDIKPSHT